MLSAPVIPMPEAWVEQIGTEPYRVTLFERTPGGSVYVRWTRRRRATSRSLGFAVRDGRLRLRKTEQGTARRIAERVNAALASGGDPVAALSEPHATAKPVAPLLGEALDLAFAPERGLYVTQSKHRRDMKRAASVLVDALGREWSFENLKGSTARRVWEHALKRALTRGGGPTGYGMARKAVFLLFNVAKWLWASDLLPAAPGDPPRGWQAKLRTAWADAFGTCLPDANELRHTHEETVCLVRGRDRADPRLWTCIEVGAELRVGQLIRSMRSDLDLAPSEPSEGAPHGKLTVHGRGKKLGEVVFLTADQRAWIDQCLGPDGHLSELEAAFQAGKIDNYYLWQKGRLRRGKIPLDSHYRDAGPVDGGTLISWFRAFERDCGVEHVPGRSWYGLRRVLADLAPSYTTDDRVLNRLTGHADSTMRERIYQAHARAQDREEAAHVRDALRRDLAAGVTPPRRAERPDPVAWLEWAARFFGVDLDDERRAAFLTWAEGPPTA